jgi:HSP20 family molecular chaperone IbpA
MWDEASARLAAAERRHRRSSRSEGSPGGEPAWEPPANVVTNGSELHVTMTLPGMRADAITVEVTERALWIEARVAPPSMAADFSVLRLEIPYGRMRRRIELPPGRFLVVERRLNDGCLFLRLMGFAE